jgi:hypothetical protein
LTIFSAASSRDFVVNSSANSIATSTLSRLLGPRSPMNLRFQPVHGVAAPCRRGALQRAFQWQRRAASAGVEGMPAGEFKFAALAPATNLGKRLRPSLGEAVCAEGKQPPAGDARPQPARRLTARAAGPIHWDNRARRDERSLGHAATKDWDRPHIGRSVLGVIMGDAPEPTLWWGCAQ